MRMRGSSLSRVSGRDPGRRTMRREVGVAQDGEVDKGVFIK